jgi:pilus assembly protein CpaE
MAKNAFALLIQHGPTAGGSLREMLENGEARMKVQCVQQVRTALARVAGGGVDVVVLDLSSSETPEAQKLDSLLSLRAGAPQVPLVVVSAGEAGGSIARAMEAGGVDHVPVERCQTDLYPTACAAIEKSGKEAAPHIAHTRAFRKTATTVAILGAKGGVGTTTVALNVAAALAGQQTVILAEMRPDFGTLWQYFRPHLTARNISHLFHMGPEAICAAETEKCLWAFKNLPGMKLLFGPRTLEQCGEIAPDSSKALPATLSTMADFVVLDLPPSLSEANRTAIANSDSLLLVVERDPFSVGAGKQVLDAVRSWNVMPPSAAAVVVNRASVGTPIDVSDIETKLAVPVIGLVPPAPDLCIAAQRAGVPLVLFEPESLAALAMSALADRVANRV